MDRDLQGALVTLLEVGDSSAHPALALLGTLGNAAHQALADPQDREAAVITLVTTASGITLLGIGSAFWGLAFGLIVRAALRRARR